MEDSHRYEYKTVTGYFKHDEQLTGPEYRATTATDLGLIDRVYDTDLQFDPRREKTQWERFEHFVLHLNLLDPNKARYKVIYITRHGLGYHNLMVASVSRQEWESYWSRLDGNGRMTWADSRLTEEGIKQAEGLEAFWRDALSNSKIPAPQKYYTSPLDRCLQTTNLVFSGLDLPQDRPFKPIVKEPLRERLGVETCNRRSTRSWIRTAYPNYEFEAGFTEVDELWDSRMLESVSAHISRAKALLDDIFNTDDSTFLSFTTHSGTIQALYKAAQHPVTWVAAGAVVPLFVKAERVDT